MRKGIRSPQYRISKVRVFQIGVQLSPVFDKACSCNGERHLQCLIRQVRVSICLSVCRPSVISVASIRRISVNFDIRGFMEICRESLTLVKIGQKCRALCLKT